MSENGHLGYNFYLFWTSKRVDENVTVDRME